MRSIPQSLCHSLPKQMLTKFLTFLVVTLKISSPKLRSAPLKYWLHFNNNSVILIHWKNKEEPYLYLLVKVHLTRRHTVLLCLHVADPATFKLKEHCVVLIRSDRSPLADVFFLSKQTLFVFKLNKQTDLSLFTCGGPCHPSRFKHCSGTLFSSDSSSFVHLCVMTLDSLDLVTLWNK